MRERRDDENPRAHLVPSTSPCLQARVPVRAGQGTVDGTQPEYLRIFWEMSEKKGREWGTQESGSPERLKG